MLFEECNYNGSNAGNWINSNAVVRVEDFYAVELTKPHGVIKLLMADGSVAFVTKYTFLEMFPEVAEVNNFGKLNKE